MVCREWCPGGSGGGGGGGGGRHLVAVPPGVGGDRRPWGGGALDMGGRGYVSTANPGTVPRATASLGVP